MSSVLVLGAGLTGLSTAIYLTQKGFQVTILERRPYAGGRTYSFTQDFWPFPIDNGPHVMLGCYTELLELLDLVGGGKKLDPQSKLNVQYLFSNGETANLSASGLPAPFHLLSGLLKFSPLRWKQQWNITRAFLIIRFQTEQIAFDGQTAMEWLVNNGQDKHSITVFWRPLVLATLNEQPENVSFLQLFRVLKLGFLRGKDASRIILLPLGLTSTLIEPIINWLVQRNCRLLYNHKIQQIHFNNDHDKITIETNKEVFTDYDFVISAIPFNQLISSTPELTMKLGLQRENFNGNAILNLHFWYPLRLIPQSFACLLDIQSQWIFINQSNDELYHHTLVISGADSLLEQNSKDQLTKKLFDELILIIPGFDKDKITKSYLVVENNATLVCKPNIERLRPLPGKVTGNFYVAGDWTKTGLPPTMESAVRSGKMVVEIIGSRT